MKNKRIKILLFILFYFLLNINSNAEEIFNFDVTELEISEEGNIFKGFNKGTVTSNDGVTIKANTFIYNKSLNILEAYGNVKATDTKKDIIIFSDYSKYYKNEEKILTFGNSKATNKGVKINADNFEYNKTTDVLNANGDVIIDETINNYKINAESITYIINEEKIFSQGITKALVQSKYEFESSDVLLLRNEMELSSSKFTTILEKKSTFYKADKFKYFIKDELLKAENVEVIENVSLADGESDKLYFKNGFFDFKNQSFKASETRLKLKKNLFDEKENDPRLVGASSESNNNITSIHKAIFTSCKEKKDNNCPPWSIKAEKVKHDKQKKQLIYDHAFIRVFNVPVMYYPKFFHPDPSVKRQSGFLKPRFNESDILGSSLNTPYFYVISENKDLTFKPTIFDSGIQMWQNEYRQQNKNSSFVSDFALTKNYTNADDNKKNSIGHFFSKFKLNLDLDKFNTSELNINIQKVTKDTYLKVFDDVLLESPVKPSDKNIMSSSVSLSLDHEKFNLSSGLNLYENLQTSKNSDRYQYVFPYYNLSFSSISNSYGSINVNSSADNNLSNTNELKSKLQNNINFYSNDVILDNFGIKNNINYFVKNINKVGKKSDGEYTSSLQSDVKSLLELRSSLPLIKIDEKYTDTLTPQLSLRINLDEKTKYDKNDRNINVSNIFEIDRLGLGDSFEAGKSITFGLNYKRQNADNLDLFGFNIASIMRENNIGDLNSKYDINKENSNIFGSANFNFSEYFKIDYDFALDNNLDKLNYNSLNISIIANNLKTDFNFIEENNSFNDTNVLENTTSYQFDDNNYLVFKTRRNRKIDLTEYYDLVYQYKNDCLTAGIKYNKTYYADRDLKPNENLMFTVTLYPLTEYEYAVDQKLYRGE